MKTSTRITIGLTLAGCAAVLIIALRKNAPASRVAGPHRQPVIMASPVQRPLAANSKPQPLHSDENRLLPPPVVSAVPPPAAPVVFNPVFMGRPPEESMFSSWAARDPEGAGRWLNQNRSHPKFADMVRGYAIQIATINPAAARQWAAALEGKGNRFGRGGTLEQHIDAIEAMLKSPTLPQAGQRQEVAGPALLADYTPILVRQYPDEPPVLEMRPTSPFV